MPIEQVAVSQPKYPLHAMTTYELRDRRSELEQAIENGVLDSAAQADLRRQLEAVIAEQEDRVRIAHE
jgi:hypothetical protein